MPDTITPEAQAVLDQLTAAASAAAFTGRTFGSRLEARTAARAGGCQTFSYGKRRFVAITGDGRPFYLGGSETAAQWMPMQEITVAPATEAPAEADADA